jgi:nicotinamide phosphoribosyltransferase
MNRILDTDSYKLSHWNQYPQGTTNMMSYFESRGGIYDKTLFFGLQYYLKKYLENPITMEEVEEARMFSALHGEPFNYDGWKYIVEELNGKLPIRIKAVPEGSVIPKSNVLMTVESTDEKVFWIVSWFETLLVRLWYPITVATNSFEIKKVIRKYLEESSDSPELELDFKLHDFGSRGATSQEASAIGGASHLVNFKGSDNISGIYLANKYYNCEMSGYSIPAAEHSTITMWGKENEVKAYENMINQYGNTSIFACVPDSYDIYNATENLWGKELKQKVSDMNATLVVRPDSGDPVEVIIDVLEILDKQFGSTINSKGYKVLNKVRVLQGDGIDINDVEEIYKKTLEKGFSATNVGFGMGGGLLQKDLNRDTHKFAFKCCWAKINNKDIEVFKNPITDTVKKSKKGRLTTCVIDNQVFPYIDDISKKPNEAIELLELVYENGKILKQYTFEEVRNNSIKNYENYDKWLDYTL